MEKARSFVTNGGKVNKGREFSSVFESARGMIQKQGVPEDQYPPKQVGFTTEEFGLERIARKGLEWLKWEYERYQPVALAVYNGRTMDMKARGSGRANKSADVAATPQFGSGSVFHGEAVRRAEPQHA